MKTKLEWIDRKALIKALESDFNTDWADYASKDYIDGVRDEYDDVLKIICTMPASDVQSVYCAENVQNNQYTFIRELMDELKEAKRLLKAAVEDFAKLDRENTKNKNCMMPEMDCADCPLSWDSVDDRVEPCHSWRYTTEALKLIES